LATSSLIKLLNKVAQLPCVISLENVKSDLIFMPSLANVKWVIPFLNENKNQETYFVV
jgi:hypothetical protein